MDVFLVIDFLDFRIVFWLYFVFKVWEQFYFVFYNKFKDIICILGGGGDNDLKKNVYNKIKFRCNMFYKINFINYIYYNIGIYQILMFFLFNNSLR